MSSKNFYGLTGDVTVDGGILNVGNAQLYANTETSNVGIGTSNPEFKLDVHGNANVGVLYATYLHGDGSNIENIVSSQWEGSPGDPIYYTSNVGIANTSPVTKTLQVGSNLYVEDTGSNVLHVTGNIYADYFVGDGSQLTGIAATLDDIVDQGNTVSNTIQIVSGQDATSNIGLVTWEGVGISVSNANPTGEYQFGVGSNLLVNVYSSNVMTVDGNVFAQKMTLGTVTITPAYNLQQITETGPTTNQTLVLSNVTTGLTADANIVVDGNVTAGSVITSGNVNAGNVITSTNINVGGDLSVTGNVYVDDMRVAEVASNLVTYDSTTGELLDSGGLFSNKLAVVSEQPPIALTGASTAVTSHGTYTIEASSGTVTELFDKNVSTVWTTSGFYSTVEPTKGVYNGNARLYSDGPQGEWVKITMPYKTILRHVKLESTNQSVEDIELVGLNADGLTWTPLKTETGLTGTTHTIIVNATTHHRTYGLIVKKTNTTTGRSAAEIGDLKLFTESFSIDGGKVAMASSAVMGGETTVDQSGPHGRLPKTVPLKKYPEIIFEDGKFDENGLTLLPVQTQAGYTVSASKASTTFGQQWTVFDGRTGAAGDFRIWRPYGYNGGTTQLYNTGTGLYDPTAITAAGEQVAQLDTNTEQGEWISVEMPKAIKLKHFHIYSQWNSVANLVDSGHLYAKNTSNDSWVKIHSFSGATTTSVEVPTIHHVNSTTSYKYFALIVTKSAGQPTIGELELYGYEEDPPLGDTSIDTTFTSIMNTPQTTGANVYVDGNLGEAFTNRVTGPDATGPSATYDDTGKYWELNGSLESNIAVEANTFLSGDQPHAVSVWFNSSNLEANVSNTCVFSISDQEKLDSVNLDLQSNTWHNLTYAYQGEGGSRVTYLDGRKVAEDQAEDTFGDYPPFPMTGYSQGGYVVSASNELSASYPAWKVFDDSLAASYDTWVTGAHYTGGTPSTHDGTETTTYNGTSTVNGEWIQLELPHKIKLSYYSLRPQIEGANDIYNERMPGTGKILGSNDGINWYLIHDHSLALSDYTRGSYTNVSINTSTNTKAYKYIRFVIETTAGTETITGIGDMKLYGHRENDLARLPDPTNVLKYPHIAMTGTNIVTSGTDAQGYHAQRNYVLTSSSGDAWNAFDNEIANTYWGTYGANSDNGVPAGSTTYRNGTTPANSGLARTGVTREVTTDTNGDSHTGSWVDMETPNKLRVSSFKVHFGPGAGYHPHSPTNYRLFGRNSTSDTWVKLFTIDGAYPNGTTPPQTGGTNKSLHTVGSTVFYKYHRWVCTKLHSTASDGTSLNNNAGIARVMLVRGLEFYGTEEATPVPIQIGGGNIDKVANFRVYDKFVGEDQALEIWDAQKDAFGRAKSSMTLHKGRLGIGTTEPEGRLAVADEPHNLEEFPPRAMTSYETYMEGHGVFKASASDEYTTTGNGSAFSAFGKNEEEWAGDGTFFTGGVLSGNGLTTITPGIGAGSWLQLELPYKILLQKWAIQQRTSQATRHIKNAILAGSNDGYTWDTVQTITNEVSQTTLHYRYYDVSGTSKQYKIFRLVITEVQNNDRADINEIKFFGTREQGQSVLHDGQLTLTKSLTVPRIGPALDADDTPRRDRLVVEYNTSTNPTFEGAVRDTSGRGNDGMLYGGASYDATEKALVFDGTVSDQYVHTLKNGTSESGNINYSVSLWFNPTTVNVARWRAIFAIGVLDRTQPTDNNGDEITLFVNNGTNALHLQNGGSSVNTGALNAGQWVHIVVTYDGTNRKIYLDGSLSVSNGYTSLNLPKEMLIRLAQSIPSGGSEIDEYMDCKISNFKAWFGAALTAEEVKTLYDMGRCDEGHHVVNFSKTRVGIGLGDGEAPRGALVVRGDLTAFDRVGIGTTNPTTELHVEGTGAIIVPIGTTAQRPTPNENGMIRLNTTENAIEFYYNNWIPLAPRTGVAIATNGLMVQLDAADFSSYPGSGTTWYDRSGNGRNGTLRGGVSWVNSGLTSYFDFSGANAQYIDQTSGGSVIYKDICIAFNVDARTSSFAYLVSKSTGADTSLRVGSTDINNPGNNGDWAEIATTYYVNGVVDTNDVPISNGQWYILGGENKNTGLLGSAWNYYLGTGFGGRSLNGRIAFVALYDRVLTASEHQQNYNALKGRYGV